MRWTVKDKHQGIPIRQYLRTVHMFSSRLIKAIIHEGGKVSVNGKEQDVRYELMPGDELAIQFPPEKKPPFIRPEKIYLPIIYEDDDLLIINKPPNMATMPSVNYRRGTVANGLLAYYEQNDIPYTVHIITRLDYETSGLMLIAKHRYCHSLLAKIHQEGQLKRKYKAIVDGHLTATTGMISKRIGRKEGSIIERTVTETGKKAVTHYQVIKELKKHSFVQIELETGCTHQIRVHFSYKRHPLLGDNLYGGSTDILKRQALHCYKLSFVHPITDEDKTFYSSIPPDMKEIIQHRH